MKFFRIFSDGQNGYILLNFVLHSALEIENLSIMDVHHRFSDTESFDFYFCEIMKKNPLASLKYLQICKRAIISYEGQNSVHVHISYDTMKMLSDLPKLQKISFRRSKPSDSSLLTLIRSYAKSHQYDILYEV